MICPQKLAARKSRIECALERHIRLGDLDHDQIIVLPLEAGLGKICGAGEQLSSI